MKQWQRLLSNLLYSLLHTESQGETHLSGLTTGCLVIANHPGLVKQWVLLHWLAKQGRQHKTDKGDLLCWMHPEAQLPRWLRPWLPDVVIQLADPVAQNSTEKLTAASKQLEQHLRNGGIALVWPQAIPATGVTAARPQLKPYGWSLLAAQQANVPVLAAHMEQTGRKVRITLLPPRPLQLADPEPRHRHHSAAQWAEDLLGEAALQHHLGHHTLWQLLCRAARQQGRNRLILTDATGNRATYQQLLARALILGQALAKESQPGECVGLLLPTSIAATTSFFALQSIGRLPALLNFTAGSAPLQSACRTAHIKTIYTSRLFVQKGGLAPLITVLQQERTVRFLEDIRGGLTFWQLLWGGVWAWWPEKRYRHLTPDARPGEPAVLLFTSGSEGEPKGVALSHDNLLANGIQMRARLWIHPEDRLLNVLPMFHAFGLTVGTLLPLLAGMRSHSLPSPLDYHGIPEVIYNQRTTLLAATDTFLAGYARTADPCDFLWVRYVVAGAEPLRAETHRLWMERFGIRILEGYGSTETSPVLAVNTPLSCRFGSVGRLLPGISHRLEAVPGIADGAQLMVQGPNIMLGYLLPDGTGHYHPPTTPQGPGWYATGDIVRVDPQGFIHILGRAKRFAKVGGEMISLARVEQLAALAWPEHRHGAVALSQPDNSGQTGEQLLLITDHPQPERATLLSHLRAQGLGEIYLPKTILTIETMPLLGSGKIDFAALTAFAARARAKKR
ncbi:MAG: AMP-binding protein [Magnetococcales bacterium]|nr:AMP-binding protein [Magnetococcales bacterium]